METELGVYGGVAEKETGEGSSPVSGKNVLASLMIVVGLVLIGLVFFRIGALLNDPEMLTAFLKLFPEQLSLAWDMGYLDVPGEVFAYALPLILLSMAGRLSITLINAGIKLRALKA